jgi:predicted transcriptional regulator
MAKTLKIRIKPTNAVLDDVRAAFKAAESGSPFRRREGVYFASIEAARNVLTPSRLALLRAVRLKRPGSIYELANLVGRDLKNVQDDLRLLVRCGLVRMSNGRGAGKRRVRVPKALFDEIELKIAI